MTVNENKTENTITVWGDIILLWSNQISVSPVTVHYVTVTHGRDKVVVLNNLKDSLQVEPGDNPGKL